LNNAPLRRLARRRHHEIRQRPSPRSPPPASRGRVAPMARAEAACIQRAQGLTGGSAYVLRSELSEANTPVTAGGEKGAQFRCRSSNDGRVAEFRLL
jgi:hypothetical protein